MRDFLSNVTGTPTAFFSFFVISTYRVRTRTISTVQCQRRDQTFGGHRITMVIGGFLYGSIFQGFRPGRRASGELDRVTFLERVTLRSIGRHVTAVAMRIISFFSIFISVIIFRMFIGRLASGKEEVTITYRSRVLRNVRRHFVDCRPAHPGHQQRGLQTTTRHRSITQRIRKLSQQGSSPFVARFTVEVIFGCRGIVL